MFKNEEGFSLLELVVAVVVAGIIAAVALPTFAGLQDKATTTSATYAASASAAEALANSTIGTTGGNGSASIQPATSINIAGTDIGDGVVTIGSTAYGWWILGYPNGAEVVISFNGLTEAKYNAIIDVLNNGAAYVDVNGLTYGIYAGGAVIYTNTDMYGKYTLELALQNHPSKAIYDSWSDQSSGADGIQQMAISIHQ